MLDQLNKNTFKEILDYLSFKDINNLMKTNKLVKKNMTEPFFYSEVFAKTTGIKVSYLKNNDLTTLQKVYKNLSNVPHSIKYDHSKLDVYFKKPLGKVTLALLSDDLNFFLQHSTTNKSKYVQLAAACGALTIYQHISTEKECFNTLYEAINSKNLELIKYICENKKVEMSRKNLDLLEMITQNEPQIYEYLKKQFPSNSIPNIKETLSLVN